jgi:signal transduction histidine kinase
MSWRNGIRLPQTVSFRLTLWYTVLFTVVSTGIFTFIFFSIGASLRQRIDEYLLDQAMELEVVSYIYSLDDLTDEVLTRSQIEGVRDTYIRVFFHDPDTKFTSDLAQWKGLPPGPVIPKKLKAEEVEFGTVDIPGRQSRTRIIDKMKADGTLIEIGYSLEQYERLMGDYIRMFGVAIIAMVISGGLVGWRMARKAMSGVEEVTRAALGIGRGDLSRRVPLSGKGREIENLTTAFNTMIEEIQNLVTELKDVSNSVAHDLRSPITRIRGVAEMAILGAHDIGEYYDMAADIIEECDRLVAIINAMLEIVETDSGIIQIADTPVDAGDLIDGVVEMYRPVAVQKGVTLSVDTASGPLSIKGDFRKLRHMLANLVDNAVKYTLAGGTVTVSARDVSGSVEISVKDTGIGIDQKDLARIFDKFYRGDESRSRQGSGLGLALARSIAEAHRATLSVESIPGQGSTFTVLFPRPSDPPERPRHITER